METIEIEIVGYWHTEPEKTFIKTCVIGVWNGISNDDHIFFYFDKHQNILGDQGDFFVLEYKVL